MNVENDETAQMPEVAERPKDVIKIGVFRIFEVGLLGCAFAVVYSFGVLRFSQMVAMAWGPIPAMALALGSIVVAVAFINSVGRLIHDADDRKETKDVDAS